MDKLHQMKKKSFYNNIHLDQIFRLQTLKETLGQITNSVALVKRVSFTTAYYD